MEPLVDELKSGGLELRLRTTCEVTRWLSGVKVHMALTYPVQSPDGDFPHSGRKERQKRTHVCRLPSDLHMRTVVRACLPPPHTKIHYVLLLVMNEKFCTVYPHRACLLSRRHLGLSYQK